MLTMICNHPDIEEFIEKKTNLDAVNKANMSIRVTNNFMEKIKKGKNFTLKFNVEDTNETIQKKIDANKLMNKIAYTNWFSGEPGALFWDRINNYSILSEYDNFEFAGTNPCGSNLSLM